MADLDPVADLLARLTDPRPLPPQLRARLEEQLLGGADEQLAARLVGAAAARPLPPRLRAGLLAELERPRRGRAAELVAAAAAVVITFAAGVVLTSEPATQRLARPAPPLGPSATASAVPRGGPPPAAAVGAPVLPSALAGAATARPAVPPQGGSPATAEASGSTTGESAAQGSAGAGAAAADTPQPTVSKVSPDAGPVAGGTRITVTGRGLSETVRLEVGGRVASDLRVESDTSLSAVTPAAARAGGAQVVVVLGDRSRHGLSPGFSYVDAPVLSTLNPDHGPPEGGNVVTITGRHFTRSSVVRFGSTHADPVEWLSRTSLRVVAPAHLPGPVDVVVVTAGGTSNSARYLYSALD